MAVEVSRMDVEFLAAIRANVSGFVARCGKTYPIEGRLLDVAPQHHEGAEPYFPPNIEIDTLDINPNSGATYIGDLCEPIADIADHSFGGIVCTEVLEHTLQPFNAVAQMHRMLKPGGFLFVSTPMNFRIHGPLPDCWRFTEHGLRALLSAFEIVDLQALETPRRPLMPIHHTVVARRLD